MWCFHQSMTLTNGSPAEMSGWWRLWGLSPEHSLMLKLLTVYFAASDPLPERGSF
jgi:hypothetical protein